MISEMRSYIKAAVLEIDPDLIEHKSPVISNNISDTKLEDTFFIFIESGTSTTDDTTIKTIFPVSVELVKNGYKDQINNYDRGYCNAIDMQARALDQSRLDQEGWIKLIDSSGITVETIASNDNAYKYTIQFNITCSYRRK